MTSQDIINTLDPDKWQCYVCLKWFSGDYYFCTSTKKICNECWWYTQYKHNISSNSRFIHSLNKNEHNRINK